jgi:hypothetical protein
VWCQEVDLDVGAVSCKGRVMYEPIGRWVNPACGCATGGERRDLKNTLTESLWWP